MKLIKPNKKYAESYYRAAEIYKEKNIKLYEFFDIPFEQIAEYTENMEKGKNLPKGWVPATCLWFVDEQDFLGEISIRHELTENLERLGGHIGYGVRYEKWGQGIGTEMLRQGILYIRENLPLKKVLLTCKDDNYGSIAVIEKNGGVLQDKIEDVVNGEKRLTRRYWIEI